MHTYTHRYGQTRVSTGDGRRVVPSTRAHTMRNVALSSHVSGPVQFASVRCGHAMAYSLRSCVSTLHRRGMAMSVLWHGMA